MDRIPAIGIQPGAATAPGGAPSGAARDADDAALVEAARRFEGLFVELMLRSMREASPGDALFGDGHMRSYEQLHDRELADAVSRKGEGLGIAKLLIEHIRAARAAPRGGEGGGR